MLLFLLVLFAHLSLYFGKRLGYLCFLAVTADVSRVKHTAFVVVLDNLVLELLSSDHLFEGLELRIFEHLNELIKYYKQMKLV